MDGEEIFASPLQDVTHRFFDGEPASHVIIYERSDKQSHIKDLLHIYFCEGSMSKQRNLNKYMELKDVVWYGTIVVLRSGADQQLHKYSDARIDMDQVIKSFKPAHHYSTKTKLPAPVMELVNKDQFGWDYVRRNWMNRNPIVLAKQGKPSFFYPEEEPFPKQK